MEDSNKDEAQRVFDKDIFRDNSRSKMFKVVCIVSAALALTSAWVGRDSDAYAISLLALAIIFLVALWLLQKTFSAARYFIPLASNGWIIFMCIAFGSALGTQNFLLICLVALAIYAKNNTYRIASIALVIFIALSIYFYQSNYPPYYPLPRLYQYLAAMNVLMPMAIISVICWNIIKDAARANTLIEKQKRGLEESNQFKDKILSIIGHDMRAPFNSAKGLLYLLENSMLSEEEKKQVISQLHADIDLSLLTLDNILGWASQSYYGAVLNTKTNKELLDISAMAAETANAFIHLAAQKQVRLSNTIVPDTFVWADRQQVAFVIRNLTSNALKFSQKGQVISFLSIENEGIVTISVKDEGIGMTQQVLSTLFSISNRSSQTGTANEKGTGLGLIFCKEFIENNNGTLWIESEANQGTTVNFSLFKNHEI